MIKVLKIPPLILIVLKLSSSSALSSQSRLSKRKLHVYFLKLKEYLQIHSTEILSFRL